jgi:hypothetical protein
MAIRTVVILSPTQVKSVDDIQKFSTKVPVRRIMELIKQEEEHRSSEQIISDIKMHRYERSEPCQKQKNVMSVDSNGKSARA